MKAAIRIEADLARVAEGLCPDLEHGALEPTDDGWGFCEGCDNDWRVEGRTVYVRDERTIIRSSGFGLVFVTASEAVALQGTSGGENDA